MSPHAPITPISAFRNAKSITNNVTQTKYQSEKNTKVWVEGDASCIVGAIGGGTSPEGNASNFLREIMLWLGVAEDYSVSPISCVKGMDWPIS